MTTKFPQLPVLGHVPKKRKENLDKVLTLREIYAVLDAEWVTESLASVPDGDFDHFLHCLRDEFRRAARRAPRVGGGKR